jgi:hypothetical protein
MYGASHVFVTNLTPAEEHYMVDDLFYIFSHSDKNVRTIIHYIESQK